MYRQTFQNAGYQALDPYTQSVLNQNQQIFEETIRKKQQQQMHHQQQIYQLMQNQTQIMNALMSNNQMYYPQPRQQIMPQYPQYVNLKSITLKPLEYYSQQMSSVQYQQQPQQFQAQQQQISSRSTNRLHGFKREARSIEVQTEEDQTQYELNKRMGLANSITTNANQNDGWGPKDQDTNLDLNNPNLANGKDWGFKVAPGQQPQQQDPNVRQKHRELPPGMTREQRAKQNLQIFKNQFIYIALYWWRLRGKIEKNRQYALNSKGKDMIVVLKNFLEIFKKNQAKIIQTFANNKDNLDISDKHKLLQGEMDKRVKNMKSQIKKLFQTLVISIKPSDLSLETINILGKITHNYEFPPQNFLFQFEVNRFEYTAFGALKNVTDIRAECFIITFILIRIYIFRLILKPWQDFPNQIKKKELLESNCNIVGSLMYEIIMDYIHKNWFKVGGNQAHLPSKYKTYFRELGPLLSDKYQLPEDPAEVRQVRLMEEPLIMGLQKREDMKLILEEDKAFCLEMEKYIAEWSKGIFQRVHLQYVSEKEKEKKERFEKKIEYIKDLYKNNAEAQQQAINLANQIYQNNTNNDNQGDQ